MSQNAREEILTRLKQIEQPGLQQRPPKIPQVDLPDDMEGRIATFTAELEAKAGVVYRASDTKAALETLNEIADVEGIKTVLRSGDDTVLSFDLEKWGESRGVSVLKTPAFSDKNEFRSAAFAGADAGITGIDYGFSESGTLAIRHRKENARLISLAPPIHIAICPVDRLHRYYEDVIPELFSRGETTPSQLTFITGPSLTADIAATMTVGMHGPIKLFTIIVG